MTDKFSKSMLIAILLFLLGISRMLLVSFEFEATNSWIQALAPKPNVFLNQNYYQKKILRLYKVDKTFIDVTFEKDQTWPFKNGMLASYYPVLRVLDRPQISRKKEWKDYVNLFICQKRGDIFNKKFAETKFIEAQSFIQVANGKWKMVQEFKCK